MAITMEESFLYFFSFKRVTRSMVTMLVIACFFEAMGVGCPARGQIVIPQNSTSPFQSRLTLQNGGENAALTIHRDPLNRPCLNIEAASRSHAINPNVYDHVISVYNRCVKVIKLRVCYYNSQHCIDMEIPGSQRKDTVLGIYPNMRYFRFSYREKF